MLQTMALKKLVGESERALSEILAQEQSSEGDILPLPSRQAKIQSEMEAWSQTLENKMYEGLKSCITALERCENLPLSKDVVIEELQKCIRSIKTEAHFAQLGQSLFQNDSATRSRT